jgi:hypothetical protein
MKGKMLFRKSDGTMVEIKRYEYKNDEIYYQKIMDLNSGKTVKQHDKNTLNYFVVDKNDDFCNTKICNIDRILQKI